MLAGVFDVGGLSLQTASFETSRIIAGGALEQGIRGEYTEILGIFFRILEV